MIGGDPDRDTIDVAVVDASTGGVRDHVADRADGRLRTACRPGRSSGLRVGGRGRWKALVTSPPARRGAGRSRAKMSSRSTAPGGPAARRTIGSTPCRQRAVQWHVEPPPGRRGRGQVDSPRHSGHRVSSAGRRSASARTGRRPAGPAVTCTSRQCGTAAQDSVPASAKRVGVRSSSFPPAPDTTYCSSSTCPCWKLCSWPCSSSRTPLRR